MTLCVSVALVSTAPSARADVEQTWFLSDGNTLTNHFTSSQTVFVDGSPVGGVGIIPAVDIYVVVHADWTKRDGLSLAGLDVSNSRHIPNTEIGFETLDEPVWFPYLRPGSYDLVIDKNQDGVYEAGFDEVVGTPSAPGFTVTFDGNRTAIDKEGLKNEFAAPWEQVAAEADLMTSAVQTFQVADEVSSFADGALTLALTPSDLGTTECMEVPCGVVPRAAYYATGNIEAISNVWGPSVDVGTVSANLLCQKAAEAVRGAGATCAIHKPTALMSSEDFGSEQLALAAKNLHGVAAGIRADPPDPAFRSVFPYTAPATTFQPVSASAPAAAQARLANDLNQMAMRGRVLLHAIERFDGAVAANDSYWAGQQAAAIRDQSSAIIDLIEATNTDALLAAAQMRAAGVPLAIPDRAGFGAFQDRLLSTGFTSTELAGMRLAGWSEADIAAMKDQLTEVPVANTPADGAAVLESVPAIATPAEDALYSLSNYADGIAQTAPTATATPTASPTATPTVKPTATPTPTPTPTVKPSASPSPTFSPTPTIKPTISPTTIPTASPTVKPTASPSPTVKPTPTPTVSPTPTGKPTPSPSPSVSPTSKPTASPTPSPVPTARPTASPTPTVKPTATPAASPTPTVKPTPSPRPTATATPTPSVKPTSAPMPTPTPTTVPSIAPTVDVSVSADQPRPSSTITTTPLVTHSGSELLVAYIQADGPMAPTQQVTGVYGGGLTWKLAARSNATWGTTEVWFAWSDGLFNSSVTASLAARYDGSLTVTAYRNAARTPGAIAVGAGISNATTAQIVPSAANSLLAASVHDWTTNVTPKPIAGQVVTHWFNDSVRLDAFWVQAVVTGSSRGVRVNIGSLLPGNHRWTVAAVEIPPAGTPTAMTATASAPQHGLVGVPSGSGAAAALPPIAPISKQARRVARRRRRS